MATSRLPLALSFYALLLLQSGVVGAFAALALLRLIGLFANLFFFQRWPTGLVSPAGNHLGALVVFVPVLGGLIVGVMARQDFSTSFLYNDNTIVITSRLAG